MEVKVSFEMFCITPTTDIFNLQLKACYDYTHKSALGKYAICVSFSWAFYNNNNLSLHNLEAQLYGLLSKGLKEKRALNMRKRILNHEYVTLKITERVAGLE